MPRYESNALSFLCIQVRCPFCRELCSVGPPHEPFLDHARACKKALRSGVKVPCPQCGRFLNRQSLDYHMEYVHKKNEGQKVRRGKKEMANFYCVESLLFPFSIES